MEQIWIIFNFIASGSSFLFSLVLFIMEIVVAFQECRRMKQRWQRHLRLITAGAWLQLAFADMITACTYWIAEQDKNPTICVIQAFLMQTFQLSAILWTGGISLMFFLTLYVFSPKKLISLVWCTYGVLCVVCWGIPLTTATYAYISESFGPSGTPTWCWFTHSMQWFILFYGELIAVIILQVVLMIAHLKWKPQAKDFDITMFHPMNTLFMGFTLMFLLVWTIPILDRSTRAWHHKIEILSSLHFVVEPLQGSFNFVVYLLCFWRRKSENEEEIQDFTHIPAKNHHKNYNYNTLESSYY